MTNLQDCGDNTCPRCGAECNAIALSQSRGKIFVCNNCTIKVLGIEGEQALLWYRESDHLWEDLGQPEGIKKLKQVKVILAIPPEKIDYHPGFIPPKL